MDRSTSTAARLNWRIHGCLAGWRTWPAPPDTSQSSYDAEAHSSSVIAGQGESGRPSARDPKCGYGVTELRVPYPRVVRSRPGSILIRRTGRGGMRIFGERGQELGHPLAVLRAPVQVRIAPLVVSSLLPDIRSEGGRVSGAGP